MVNSRRKSPGTVQPLTAGCSDPSSLKPASEASPVPCLKEPFKNDMVFGSGDYVFSFRGRAGLSGGNAGLYFVIEVSGKRGSLEVDSDI